MQKLIFVAVCFLISLGFLQPLQAKTLFHDDFSDGENWEDDWYHLGSDGGEMLQTDGNLEIVGGALAGNKQTSAIVKEQFDFSGGVTFQGVITSAGPDEVQFWVANEDGKGQAEDDPWFTSNWIRVMLHNDSVYIQRANPDGTGMAGEGAVPMTVGEPYKISVYMTPDEYTVYVNGEEIISGEHAQNYTEGYLIFAVWTTGAAINENYKIDDVFVYEGDYDPNPSTPVEDAGKLTTTWGCIKAQNWADALPKVHL